MKTTQQILHDYNTRLKKRLLPDVRSKNKANLEEILRLGLYEIF